MAILTAEEKQAIRAKIEKIAEPNEYKRKNMEELQAALIIIRKVLGNSWYGKSGKNLFSQPSNNLPPIAALLSSGQPRDYIRIIAFAIYLNELWEKTNVKEKVREYERSERRGSIKLEHFNRFYFELKMASYTKKSGLNVYFIPKAKTKTPDLEISCKDGKTYVECKKKDPETSVQSVFNSIGDAANQLLEANAFGIAAIEVSFVGKNANTDLEKVLYNLPKLLEVKPHVNAVVLCVETPYAEEAFTGLRTNFHAYLNPKASIRLPSDIENIWKLGGNARPDFPLKSLLDA